MFFLCLCICLQPSRRPSLQPSFSLDCVSAPSPHHCLQSQHFASQLSLCIGNPHPSSSHTCSLPPSPMLSSLPPPCPHHFSLSASCQPHPAFQSSTCYNSSPSQHNTELDPESKLYPSLLCQPLTTVRSLPHRYSRSLSTGSCPNKTNVQTNDTSPHPWLFSPLLSQSTLNIDPFTSSSMSNVCLLPLQKIRTKSNSNPENLLPPSFHPDSQTYPSAPPQTGNFDSQTKHPAVQPFLRPTLSPLYSDKVLAMHPASNLSFTNPHSPNLLPSVPVTTSTPFSIPYSEGPMSGPFQAGGVLLNSANLFIANKIKSVCLNHKTSNFFFYYYFKNIQCLVLK